MTAAAIRDEELGPLFDRLAHYPALLLAVSGGADSTALMVLVRRWRTLRSSPSPHVVVATVDHRLRPASTAEAEATASRAHALGFEAVVLTWKGAKPATAIQEEARAGRYALLHAQARSLGNAAIVTAHHEDDQAETLLMRLARGSGLDGLSAMRPSDGGIERPLLAISKSRLIATLEAAGETWIEDPSNENTLFERVRLRAARPVLDELGLASRRIALSATRLQRARAALESIARDVCHALVETHGGAFAALNAERFLELPEELQVRVLLRVLEAYGGQGKPPPLVKAEQLADALGRNGTMPVTLAGCFVSVEDGDIRIWREPGRTGLPENTVVSHHPFVWDHRFRVRVTAPETMPLRIAALGAAGIAEVRKNTGLSGIPRRAAETLPGAWSGEKLLAYPPCGNGPPEAISDGPPEVRLEAEFLWAC